LNESTAAREAKVNLGFSPDEMRETPIALVKQLHVIIIEVSGKKLQVAQEA
jgi:hypothetical protein